jgi:hypothetical protein
MPTRPLDPALAKEAWDAWQRHGGKQTHGAAIPAAAELGLTPQTLRDRANKYQPVDPAIQASMDAVGSGMVPQLAWLKTKNDNGTSYSVLLKPAQPDEADLIDRIRDAFGDMDAAPPVAAPAYNDADLLAVYPLADVHIGMMAWGRETGEDYDTRIAAARVREWVGRCIAASPAAETAVILDVGDLTHADDQMNQTPKSKHQLDVDTRHFRTLDITIATLTAAIDLALAKHKHVLVRILPGNHNPTSFMAVIFAVAAWYRNEPRVMVHKDPSEFFAMEWGQVMLAAHHGDKAKAERMVLFLADQYPEMWGRTRHRFLFTGHLHHHKSADIGGVQWEQLRAVTSRDAYAVSHAYTARAQMQGITYHKERGEIQRVKVGL